MKNTILFFLVIPAFILCISCQKELNYSTDDQALATIVTDTNGNCLPIPVHGTYKVDSLLNDSNYVMLKVNVDATGAYSIITNTVNGYYFKAEGFFNTGGINDIQLRAYGTPLAEGVNNFTVSLDSSSCSFDVSVSKDTGSSDTLFNGAAGTLANEQGVFIGLAFVNLYYAQNGMKTIEIKSNYYPRREIYYDVSGKIDKIDYYLGADPNYTFDYSAKFVYDSNNDVVAILRYKDSMFTDSLFSFKYNTEHKLIFKGQFTTPVQQITTGYGYDGSGNMTKIYHLSGTTIQDSITVEYDTRVNTFMQIHPQYEFMDFALVFDQTNKNEIFYYSTNYPVKLIRNSTETTVGVETASNNKPSAISFDNVLWFTYTYNQ